MRAAESSSDHTRGDGLTSSQEAWVRAKAAWERISVGAVRSAYEVPAPEHLNEDGTARRCANCRDDRAAWDHGESETQGTATGTGHTDDCDDPSTCKDFGCDVCRRMVPRCNIDRAMAFGIETHGCRECWGVERS